MHEWQGGSGRYRKIPIARRRRLRIWLIWIGLLDQEVPIKHRAKRWPQWRPHRHARGEAAPLRAAAFTGRRALIGYSISSPRPRNLRVTPRRRVSFFVTS